MLILISGVSGAGKDTVKKELMKLDSTLVDVPSYTTRNMREGEVNGVNYHFVSKEQFEELINNNALYEYNFYNNNYYGTSKELIRREMDNGNVPIIDIDVNGAENLTNILREDTKVITIFLRVPKDALYKRLKNRTEKLSDEDIEDRLNRMEYEESRLFLYDYVVKNNNLEKTVNVIRKIIEEERKDYNLEF
jgi:guanylate kinase